MSAFPCFNLHVKKYRKKQPHSRCSVGFLKEKIVPHWTWYRQFFPSISTQQPDLCLVLWFCYTSPSTQELHWKMQSSTFWNTDGSLPLALLLPPGCIRLSTKFRFNHPLFTHENTRNHIWLICKKKICSYRECQEHKLLQRKLPFISSSVLLMAPAWRKWHPQGPFHCCLKINKYSPSPWLKSLHGITYLDDYNKFQWRLLLLVLLFLIFSLYKHNFPSACK